MKELSIKDVVKKVVEMFFKVQWYPVQIPFKDGDNNTIWKNLEQQFMKVTKLKPNLCTTYRDWDRETDRNGCFHWTLIPPS